MRTKSEQKPTTQEDATSNEPSELRVKLDEFREDANAWIRYVTGLNSVIKTVCKYAVKMHNVEKIETAEDHECQLMYDIINPGLSELKIRHKGAMEGFYRICNEYTDIINIISRYTISRFRSNCSSCSFLDYFSLVSNDFLKVTNIARDYSSSVDAYNKLFCINPIIDEEAKTEE